VLVNRGRIVRFLLPQASPVGRRHGSSRGAARAAAGGSSDPTFKKYRIFLFFTGHALVLMADHGVDYNRTSLQRFFSGACAGPAFGLG
jgi:hypothetical protein